MKPIVFLLLMLLLIGCRPDKFDYGLKVSETAINLGNLNSAFDDYNSNISIPAKRMKIFFSSNRNSGGEDFDIVGGKLDFAIPSDDDILYVKVANDGPPYESEWLFPKINSEQDELGPYSYYLGNDLLFFYATNPNDTFDIKFVELKNWDYSQPAVSESISLTGINKLGDNLYPSIDAERKKIYFCSNREDSCFHIYSAEYHSEITKQSLVNNDLKAISKEDILSSDSDDKCPYVKDNFMVFTSKRDGSYDLWYSVLENDRWSEPLKFDDKINSDYNEYRPVIFEMLGFNLMIYSSDRPNGKGGYDLYIVKIDKYKS